MKSHGGANPKGVANAIGVAARMVRNDITRKIGEDLDNFRAHAFADEAARMTRRSVVIGTGSALPARRVDNAELADDGRHIRRVDRRAHRDPQPLHRRRRRDHRDASRPTPRAARSTRPGIDATDIGLIVLATATPDQTFPSSATKVQAMLGIDDCIAFDVHAVCTGFLYALTRRRLDAARRAAPSTRW